MTGCLYSLSIMSIGHLGFQFHADYKSDKTVTSFLKIYCLSKFSTKSLRYSDKGDFIKT